MSVRSPADSHALIAALVCGATIETAARQAGMSDAEAKRLIRAPNFRAKLRRGRSEMIERVAGLFTGSAVQAVRTLLDLQAVNQPAPVRLGAARAILELGSELRAAAELADRLRDV